MPIRSAFSVLALVALLGCGPAPGGGQAPVSDAEPTGAPPQAEVQSPQRLMPTDEGLKAKYIQSCYSCHSIGVNGAPRSGVWSQWQSRFEQGLEVLVDNTRNGIRAMPPKGMCVNCSDEDYRALILFMANRPDAPAPESAGDDR